MGNNIKSDVQYRILADYENNSFQLLANGWNGQHYVFGPVFHFDIINNKIWMQCNNTEDCLRFRSALCTDTHRICGSINPHGISINLCTCNEILHFGLFFTYSIISGNIVSILLHSGCRKSIHFSETTSAKLSAHSKSD
jgi:hypothetical protein